MAVATQLCLVQQTVPVELDVARAVVLMLQENQLCLVQKTVPGCFERRAAPNASKFPEEKLLHKIGLVVIILSGNVPSYELFELHGLCCSDS